MVIEITDLDMKRLASASYGTRSLQVRSLGQKLGFKESSSEGTLAYNVVYAKLGETAFIARTVLREMPQELQEFCTVMRHSVANTSPGNSCSIAVDTKNFVGLANAMNALGYDETYFATLFENSKKELNELYGDFIEKFSSKFGVNSSHSFDSGKAQEGVNLSDDGNSLTFFLETPKGLSRFVSTHLDNELSRELKVKGIVTSSRIIVRYDRDGEPEYKDGMRFTIKIEQFQKGIGLDKIDKVLEGAKKCRE